jgi:hypothetical protein
MEPLAYGELALKPREFYYLTPYEFFRLWDGFQARKSDLDEFAAQFVAILANASGNLKHRMSAQDILGRPFRRHWDEAMAKDTDGRLAEKDRKRREQNKERQRQQRME